MALMNADDLKRGTLVQIANRNDICELCKREIRGKDDVEFNKKLYALRGKEEGKPMLKLKVSGAEVSICMAHIHQIAEQNPITPEG